MTKALVAATGVLLIGLTGCSSKSDAPTPEPTTPAPSETAVISPPKLTSVPDLKKETGIVKDTTMTECTAVKGKVTAKGTVKNSGDSEEDIVVVVSWIVPQGSDVVARGVAVVKNAKAGSSHDWDVSSTVKVDTQTQCVLSARRGTISDS